MFIETNLNDSQKNILQDLFRCTGDWTQPHVAAQRLGLKRQEAIALLDSLVRKHSDRFNRRHLVYHTCSDAPVASIPDTEVIKVGWICPQCEEEIEEEVELDSLTLDFCYTAIAPVNFAKPDDGLVRYWRVEYFPFYVKGFSPNVEPAIILPQDKAQEFDGLVEAARQGQDRAFKEIANQYRDVVEAIVQEVV